MILKHLISLDFHNILVEPSANKEVLPSNKVDDLFKLLRGVKYLGDAGGIIYIDSLDEELDTPLR
jgi:hypothetical protein